MKKFLFIASLLLGNAEARIDLLQDWRFHPDPQNEGIEKGWQAPDVSDTEWTLLEAGRRWEDQGFPEIDGFAWYRKWIDVPKDWEGQRVWFGLGGANDAYSLYVNGKVVNSFGDTTEDAGTEEMTISESISTADRATVAEVGSFLKYGEQNLIALRFCDWGGSGGPWKEPCLLTVDPKDLPPVPEWSAYIDTEDSALRLDLDLAGLGRKATVERMKIRIDSLNGDHSINALRAGIKDRIVSQEFPLETAKESNTYSIEIGLLDSKGAEVSPQTLVKKVEYASFPPTESPEGVLKARNNFVWDLELVEETLQGYDPILKFTNPRDGWVYMTRKDAWEISGITSPVPPGDFLKTTFHKYPNSKEWVSMVYLPKGEHRIYGFNSDQVKVQTVPELAYSYYPCSPHILAHGDYDWDYLQEHILPTVNVLVTHGVEAEVPLRTWRMLQGKWIANTSLPGLSGPPPDPEEVFQYWAENPGVQESKYAGMIVDEFIGASPHHYQAWTEAAKKLFALSQFKNKTFYAWCGDIYKHTDQPTKDFIGLLMEGGHRFALEKYLDEPPTEQQAKRSLYRSLTASLEGWKEAYPGWENHVLICLGYMSAPPESLNVNPGVDYKVYMDMQFHHLATDPSFWGLYGIMEYTTSYADEEIVRWAHRLFRHYCIEGNRERFTSDPYHLPHLMNPDFEQGLSQWRAAPAESGSIDTGRMEGFSWLQGRYPETTRGDTYLVMKRSDKAPNRVAQTLYDLDPDRLYSVKLISAAIDELHQEKDLGLRIEIEGGEIQTGFSFQECYPSNYAHERGGYTRDHPAHFNYHRVVIQPRSATATLTLSDWKSETEPGGPFGQRLALNFVEVQPFFTD